MTAKEYLGQIKPIQRRIETLVQQRNYLKSQAEYCGISYGDLPHNATRNINRNEDAFIRLIDWNDKIAAEYAKLDEINKVISGVEDPTAQAVLVKKYICGKTWYDISKELFISRSRLFEIHKDALKEIEKSGLFVPILDG
jgi:hypothetical protein